MQLSDALWVRRARCGCCPQRDGFQFRGVKSGLGRVGRKKDSLMDTRRRTLALCFTSWERLCRGHADGERCRKTDF